MNAVEAFGVTDGLKGIIYMAEYQLAVDKR